MANHEPDKEMFDQVKEGIKKLTDILTQWQQKETAIHSLAEVHAKASGAPAEQMDAHTYAHKRAIKKAMAEQAKQMDPEAQGMGPAPIAPPSMGGAPMGGMIPPVGGPSAVGQPPIGGSSGQGGPGKPMLNPGQQMTDRMTPRLPMAGQPQNTGANGWEGLMKPTPYPGQAQQQTGAPTQSTGQITQAQQPMPGMPTPGVPGGATGPSMSRFPSQSNPFPGAQPPLTRPMR